MGSCPCSLSPSTLETYRFDKKLRFWNDFSKVIRFLGFINDHK